MLYQSNAIAAARQPLPAFSRALVCLFLAMLGLPNFPTSAAQLQPGPPPAQRPMPRTVIIDTDAGADDLMAVAFLLSRPDIRVEAITVVNGNADVSAGGRNVLRLLELAGRRDISVSRK